ncbi:MAG: RING finger protein [Oscillospiraceae bacterium]
MSYDGEKCPICAKEFTEDDDVVVCPICGTPHHRSCYLNNKDCANVGLHASGYIYEKSALKETLAEVKENSQSDKHTIVFCPNCGKENSGNEPACTSCGTRLYFKEQAVAPKVAIPSGANGQYFDGVNRIPPSETIGGNTVADTAEFVQISANRYVPKMYKMEKMRSKISWNWAAFLFSPYWFFYRKMHTVGFLIMIVLLVITGFCSTKNVLEQSQATSETLYEFYQGNATQEDVVRETYKMQMLPENIILTVATLSVHLYAGLFGNYHYKKKVKNDVAEIKKNSNSDENFRFMLFRKGGISGIMCALSWLGFFCANQILLTALSKMLL